LNNAQFLLSGRQEDPEQLRHGDAESRRALARYGLPNNPNWRELPSVLNLPPEDRDQLNYDFGDLLFLLAKSTRSQTANRATDEERNEGFQLAMNLTSQAESCYGRDRTPRAVLEQRSTLAKELHKTQEAQEIDRLLSDFKQQTPKDDYWGAQDFAIKGNFRAALKLLQKVTQNDPRNFPAWFVRGTCYHYLLRESEAIACFSVCVALRPDFSQCWQNRGLAHLQARNYRQAIEDFDKAIQLQSNLAEAYINRAVAHRNMGKLDKAIVDLTDAIQIEGRPSRAYFERAEVRRMMGDKAGADLDMFRGRREAPKDAESWVARGYSQIESDPQQALADFEEALKVDRRCFKALQNKAAVLDDKLHKGTEALEVMNEAVRLFPDSVLTRGGHGVLLARIGKRTEALIDAQEALLLDSGPPTLYQVACIYALTSKQEPADQFKALNLLSSALRTGFALEWIDTDSDLDPIRKLPEFAKAVAAARALAASANGPQKR
jgi:tetratricopeptide (TPR) repeat protein